MQMFLFVGGKGKCVAELNSCRASGKAGEGMIPDCRDSWMNLLCPKGGLSLFRVCLETVYILKYRELCRIYGDQLQRNMQKGSKKRALTPSFASSGQLVLSGFETPFSQKLVKTNRWVLLADRIPWDEVCNIYSRQVGLSHTGRPPISPRVVTGSLLH
jgi:hypothetical protein